MNLSATDFEKRYATMSDEELALVRKEDLLDVARACYEREVAARTSKPPVKTQLPESSTVELPEVAVPKTGIIRKRRALLIFNLIFTVLLIGIGVAADQNVARVGYRTRQLLEPMMGLLVLGCLVAWLTFACVRFGWLYPLAVVVACGTVIGIAAGNIYASLALWCAVVVLTARVASSRGHQTKTWAIAAIVVGPFALLVALLFLRRSPDQYPR